MRARGRPRFRGRRRAGWAAAGGPVVLAFTVTPNPVGHGGTATFTVTWAGGAEPFDVVFSNGETGGGGAGGATSPHADDFAYFVAGTYTASVTVTDATGAVARAFAVVVVT